MFQVVELHVISAHCVVLDVPMSPMELHVQVVHAQLCMLMIIVEPVQLVMNPVLDVLELQQQIAPYVM